MYQDNMYQGNMMDRAREQLGLYGVGEGNAAWGPSTFPVPEQPSSPAPEEPSSPSFMANLTGIPDTNAAAQHNALALALLAFGASVAKNNQPGMYGRPRLGNLLAQGAYEGMQGLTTAASNWDKRQADTAKTRLDVIKAKADEENLADIQKKREALERLASGKGLPGDDTRAGVPFMTPGAAGTPQSNNQPGIGVGKQAKAPQGRPGRPGDIDWELAKIGALYDTSGNRLSLPRLKKWKA